MHVPEEKKRKMTYTPNVNAPIHTNMLCSVPACLMLLVELDRVAAA